MKKMMKEFKAFIMRGNVIDMAVGVIVGGAFSKIVSSLVNDIVMPLITLITGKISFTDLFIALDGGEYVTLAEASAAGASVFAYGNFIQIVVEFLIIAAVVFAAVKAISQLHKPAETPAPVEKKTKECPYCKTEIHKDAVKCPHCTSDLQ